ncbi:MAG: alpha-xylosidase, partial [Bacteroidales bacterium]|nr:alpha-xylosidase [Bacteroidales bacterium]
MKHSSFLFFGLSLLTGAVSVGAEVVPQAQTVQQSAVPHITTVRQLNSTTIEVEFSNRQMATIDFYGKNIFRLFRDSVGGLVRSPEATPPAQILVNNPRRDAGSVVLDTTNPAAVVISTDRLRLTLYRRTGLMVVTDLQRGIDVVEEALPCEVKKDKVSLTLTANVDEYFYGGGVQNGRFSHRAKS